MGGSGNLGGEWTLTQNVRLERPWGNGRIVHLRDATLNDSDKNIITVPTGKIIEPLWLIAEIYCTATVGNRNLLMTISNGANVIFVSGSSGAITASQNGQLRLHFNTSVGAYTTATYSLVLAGINASRSEGVPRMLLPAGYIIRIYDITAVDAAQDDLTITMEYLEYDA